VNAPVFSALLSGLRQVTVRPISESPCERLGCGQPAKMGPSVGGRHVPLCEADLRKATERGWVQVVDKERKP
jgi:hypothetical protein